MTYQVIWFIYTGLFTNWSTIRLDGCKDVVQQCRCECTPVFDTLRYVDLLPRIENTFHRTGYILQTTFFVSDSFWKHGGKRRNCNLIPWCCLIKSEQCLLRHWLCVQRFSSWPFTTNKDLALSKFKTICRRQIKCCAKHKFVFLRIENIVWKRENAAYEHFHNVLKSPLPKGCL